MEVEDLFVDLADGIKLLKLLEIISGEKLGKPNNGRMRVHKIENVNKSLAFLHTKVSEFFRDTGPIWVVCGDHFNNYFIISSSINIIFPLQYVKFHVIAYINIPGNNSKIGFEHTSINYP